MRIKIVHRPTMTSIDGIRLDGFEPGYVYDVGTTIGILMLAEGWAQPVLNDQPALLAPLGETDSSVDHPERLSSTTVSMSLKPRARSNLIRDLTVPTADVIGTAADFQRRKRRP